MIISSIIGIDRSIKSNLATHPIDPAILLPITILFTCSPTHAGHGHLDPKIFPSQSHSL